MNSAQFRTETDSLGELRVPSDALYGIQTERARLNFPFGDRGLPWAFIVSLARIKRAAATVHRTHGRLRPDVADAIVQAASEVVGGQHAEQFPVSVFQTGSGTSTNMNLNEVLANRAAELLGHERGKKAVHANDQVNLGQSSNDVIPSALHIAALCALRDELEPALGELEQALANKAMEFADLVKIGRTHYQDAVPMRLGHELGAYRRQVSLGLDRLRSSYPSLAELALGATAVGTGLNAPPGFADEVIALLALELGLPLVGAEDRFEALGARDAAVHASGQLKGLAVSLMKIANDLRLLSSGPRCGLGEIRLPELQPGSSIMPGKVNPVLPEAVCMVAAQVIGNDATITVAGASGVLELNVMTPLIAHNLLESTQLLTVASQQLARHCIGGIRADAERCAAYVEQSLGLATALVPVLGYDRAAKLAQRANASGRSVRELAAEQLGEAEAGRLLDVQGLSTGLPSG